MSQNKDFKAIFADKASWLVILCYISLNIKKFSCLESKQKIKLKNYHSDWHHICLLQ